MQTAERKGREEGLVQGREEGLAEGLVKGRGEMVQEIARKMKNLNLSTESIIAATGLSADEIEHL